MESSYHHHFLILFILFLILFILPVDQFWSDGVKKNNTRQKKFCQFLLSSNLINLWPVRLSSDFESKASTFSNKIPA